MFTNNKQLLYSERNINEVAFSVIKYCNQFPID
jgi:hypothetical protein